MRLHFLALFFVLVFFCFLFVGCEHPIDRYCMEYVACQQQPTKKMLVTFKNQESCEKLLHDNAYHAYYEPVVIQLEETYPACREKKGCDYIDCIDEK